MPYFESYYYETHGEKKSPPVVFLHGFMGNCESWNEIIRDLKKDFFCVAIDLPGHGKSLHLDKSAFEIPNFAEIIIRLVENVGFKEFSLVGYSLGGRQSLFLALNFPKKVKKLVLESSSPGLKTEIERSERKISDEKLAQELETDSLEQFIQKWYSQPLFESLKKDQTQFETLISKRKLNDPKGLAASLRSMGTGTQESLWGKLENLKPPTLLIVGEYDTKFQEIAHKMSTATEKIAVKSVVGAGHNVHYEKPEMYVELLKNFLSED